MSDDEVFEGGLDDSFGELLKDIDRDYALHLRKQPPEQAEVAAGDAIDTAPAWGRFFSFHVMASLGKMERELTIERTRAGPEVARQLGRKGGRKRHMTDSKIKAHQAVPRAESSAGYPTPQRRSSA